MTMQTKWSSGPAVTAAVQPLPGPKIALSRRPLEYGALVIFFALYYYRPEDFIRALTYIPMARIVGVIGFVALLYGIGSSGGKVKVPRAIKLLWLLLLQMTLCIPLAMWPGGAANTVFGKFAKGVVVAMLISMVVVSIKELRKLLWIQASAVAGVTILSILVRRHDFEGRLVGVQESILSNPNDLAINIAITFPLVLAFMIQAKGITKAVWLLCLGFMALGVVLTSSRSGLLAFIIIVFICAWEYGVKGKRRHLVIGTVLATILGMGVALSNSSYRARVGSIFLGNIEGSRDKGSAEARKALLKESIVVALTHPILGVGPGCFPLVDEGWKVAHNAYTELAAEDGIIALILFLMAMGAAFKNIAVLRKSQEYRDDPEFTLFTQAMWAGLVGYMVGSLFASTEYNLYPYFVIGYTCALVRVATVTADGEQKQNEKKTIYGRTLKTQPVGNG